MKWFRSVAESDEIRLQSDRKSTYVRAFQEFFPGAEHERYSSKTRRNYRNPLFPINHTLAQMRDGVSRLVRRTWAVSKRRAWLRRHMRLWILWRNYVRGITVKAPGTSPAMVLGLADRPWSLEEAFRWRAELTGPAQVH